MSAFFSELFRAENILTFIRIMTDFRNQYILEFAKQLIVKNNNIVCLLITNIT